jgi:hypothetical protein
MSNGKHVRVGIIAEDESDVDAARVLMRRIAGSDRIGVKKFVGKGCGKIKRKCNSWASTLKAKGCKCLIVIHDLDRNGLVELREQIADALAPCPIDPHLICIPVEEMEAWWLSDPTAIHKALKLDTTPKVKGHPEKIASPKEHIGDLVNRCSKNRKVYLNTEHNAAIAAELDFERAKRCDSFTPFFAFVVKHMKGKS